MIEPTSNNQTEHDLPKEPEVACALPHESPVGSSEVPAAPESNSTFKMVLRGIWNLPASIAIFFVRIYQWTLSPIIGRQCRFHPTCSNYYILAVRKYGFVSGTLRGFWRIVRCNPLCRGGEDFP